MLVPDTFDQKPIEWLYANYFWAPLASPEDPLQVNGNMRGVKNDLAVKSTATVQLKKIWDDNGIVHLSDPTTPRSGAPLEAYVRLTRDWVHYLSTTSIVVDGHRQRVLQNETPVVAIERLNLDRMDAKSIFSAAYSINNYSAQLWCHSIGFSAQQGLIDRNQIDGLGNCDAVLGDK